MVATYEEDLSSCEEFRTGKVAAVVHSSNGTPKSFRTRSPANSKSEPDTPMGKIRVTGFHVICKLAL